MKYELKTTDNGRPVAKTTMRKLLSHFILRCLLRIAPTIFGIVMFAALSTLTAEAATFVVLNTNDSGAGSLRQAILSANSNPGADLITFNIPGVGVRTITVTSALPSITDPVTIDGYTQRPCSSNPAPCSQPNSLVNGDNATLLIELTRTNQVNTSFDGLILYGGSNIIKGLIINGFRNTNPFPSAGIRLTGAAGNLISGNFIGTDSAGVTAVPNTNGIVIGGCSFNNIGGSTPAARNVISGNDEDGILIEHSGAIKNQIQGNFIGTDHSGTVSLYNSNGIYIDTSVDLDNAATIGGLTAGSRNIISGNYEKGIVLANQAPGVVVQGNYIGTDVSGDHALGNSVGIYCNSSGNTIGGAAAGAGNIISSNSTGIQIWYSANNNQVLGNWIGYGANGVTHLGNSSAGISLLVAKHNVIGGPGGSGNAIAFNGGAGIDVSSFSGSSVDNTISSNSIISNGGLGIDLGSNDVTPNDQGDGDTGPNNLQNFPVLSRAALLSNGLTLVSGALNSLPNTKFHIELFRSLATDPSGFGEGERFVGAFDLTTDGKGDASFNDSWTGVTLGEFISATATDPAGNTSEFSLVKQVSPDGPGSLQFSSAAYSVNENGGQATITVKRTGGSVGTDMLQYATTAGGTATAGSDFTSVSGTLVWGDFDTADKSFTVPINDDSLNETNETINLTLSNPTNGATLGSPSTAVLTITDNDSQPTISISDVSQPEGNSGTTNFTFNVTLSAASGQAVKVNYSTADNTAQAGSDYQAANGVVNFAPGETSKQINVSANGDTQAEADETFAVNLVNLINVGVGKASGVGTIVNDDGSPPAGTLQFSSASYSVNENAGQATITVKRVSGSSGAVSLKYLPKIGGTAIPGTDYTSVAGFLNWADGDSADKTITIPIIDDSLDEPDKTANIDLSSPTGGATLGSPSSAVLTIVDDDPAPKVSIDDVSLAEGNSGTTTFTFTVSLSAASGQTVNVNYTTADNTALEASDYQAANGVVTFAPGETSKQVTVLVNGDPQVEPNETFAVNLYNLNNASVGKVTGVGTIVNDDSNPTTPMTIQFSQATYSVAEELGAMAIIVTRSGDASSAAAVDYTTADGSATQKADFEYAAGTLDFAAGETSKTLTLLINEDMLSEGDETFNVVLSNPAGVALGTQSTVMVTIVDDVPDLFNPIDDAQLFVYAHYHDFLNREPDAEGLAFWTAKITSCGSDAKCLENARINVSASFFLSIEFQETAYLLYLMQKESYSTMPKYTTFMRDLQEVSRGVVVNTPGWQQKLADNQQRFAEKWINRPEFKTAYDALSNDAYVNALYKNAGIAAPQAEKDKLVGALNTASMNRSSVLLEVAEDATFRQQEQNGAFVLMEYFGYLRRDPNSSPDSDLSGYNFWLNKLNQFNGNYIDSEMIKAFTTSFEYRQRFSQ